MRFVMRAITIAECKRAVFITRGSIAFFSTAKQREREREKKKSGVSAVFILPDLFLSRHNYIAIPLINQRQPVSRRSRGLILLIFYQPTTPFTLTFELI